MPRDVQVEAGGEQLPAILEVPNPCRGLVIFAHGSGSSRLSTRNRYVADVLNERGFATLLLDLLTQSEEELDNKTRQLRFDISLLARRVDEASAWSTQQPVLQSLPQGYFGASTGAAAALLAAANRKEVRAVVSRGGRPDLAADVLGRVTAPTLLIVGGSDPVVLRYNTEAKAHMKAPCEIAIVPHASHLFEEPGALQAVAQRAAAWFERYL